MCGIGVVYQGDVRALQAYKLGHQRYGVFTRARPVRVLCGGSFVHGAYHRPAATPWLTKICMKKTFQLQVTGKHPERLLEATKHEIRKYMKRERRRALPAGVDFWDFDCRFGAAQDCAEVAHTAEIMGLLDALVLQGGQQFYVEIVAKHGVRRTRMGTDTSVAPVVGT